jgi:hypothetical protein
MFRLQPRAFVDAANVSLGMTCRPMVARWNSSTSANRRRIWQQRQYPSRHRGINRGKMAFGVAVSGGVLTFGCMFLGRCSRSEVDEDPRDIRQLSSVPLSKLCSGWM